MAEETKNIEEVIVRGKKKESAFTEDELDWMSSRKTGSLGGKVLSARQIRKLRGILKEKGIHLIVEGDTKKVTKLFKPIEEFEKAEDLFYYMRIQDPPFVGMFHAESKQFFLSKNATEIIAFHEMAHVKHFEKIGAEAYKTLNRLDKEMYVWKEILANKNKWTKAELDDALDYINRIRTESKYGYNLDPLKIK